MYWMSARKMEISKVFTCKFYVITTMSYPPMSMEYILAMALKSQIEQENFSFFIKY